MMIIIMMTWQNILPFWFWWFWRNAYTHYA